MIDGLKELVNRPAQRKVNVIEKFDNILILVQQSPISNQFNAMNVCLTILNALFKNKLN